MAHALSSLSAPDLTLTAWLEEHAQADRAPAIRELLSQRSAGATRGELERFIKQRFRDNLPLQVQCMRWLRAVEPDPRVPDPRGFDDGPFGKGGGPAHLRPVFKTSDP